MKKFVFALTATASLALAACNNNQDAVDNAQLNQPPADDLNAMSNDAASDAANSEAEALGTQQQQLDQTPANTDNTTNPTDDEEQNVAGM